MMIDKLPRHLKNHDIDDFNTLQPYEVVLMFEEKIAKYFGAPYCISTDSCTHALELSLKLHYPTDLVKLTKWTYMSVPMMLEKIGIPYVLDDIKWQNYYHINDQIIDAAVMWQSNSYIPSTLTCISFQYRKHCPIGRGGAILLDDFSDYQKLSRMVYDGRDRKLLQTEDNITSIGYHYHMLPEDAARGIKIFEWVKDYPAETKGWQDYQDLLTYNYFKNK